MFRTLILLITAVFFLSSCGGTFDSVKRGLTGQKQKSTDEFFIQKKDPLILPPDYENLPSPDEEVAEVSEEISIFESALEESSEDESLNEDSVESSILKKIQSK